MERKIITSQDGSSTIYVPALDEHYHSVKGAIQESEHIFINYGLGAIEKKEIRVFEVGFGTGLNAWLSSLYAEKNQIRISYYGIEKYPLDPDEVAQLNFAEIKGDLGKDLFLKLHRCNWNEEILLSEYFSLSKDPVDLKKCTPNGSFDICFFDAFAPDKQPELWTEEIFRKIHHHLLPGGIFITYSAKGIVRRALKAVGFTVEKLPGPPGKREITRATKK